jgi:hypothetical protein
MILEQQHVLFNKKDLTYYLLCKTLSQSHLIVNINNDVVLSKILCKFR